MFGCFGYWMKLGKCFGHDDLLARDQNSRRENVASYCDFSNKKRSPEQNSAIKEEKWLSTSRLSLRGCYYNCHRHFDFLYLGKLLIAFFIHFLLYSKFRSGEWFRVFAADFADCASWSCTQKPCHTYHSGYLEILFILPYRMVCHHRLGLLRCDTCWYRFRPEPENWKDPAWPFC